MLKAEALHFIFISVLSSSLELHHVVDGGSLVVDGTIVVLIHVGVHQIFRDVMQGLFRRSKKRCLYFRNLMLNLGNSRYAQISPNHRFDTWNISRHFLQKKCIIATYNRFASDDVSFSHCTVLGGRSNFSCKCVLLF